MIFKQQLFKPVYNGTVLVPKPNTEAGETLTVKEKKRKKFQRLTNTYSYFCSANFYVNSKYFKIRCREKKTGWFY